MLDEIREYREYEDLVNSRRLANKQFKDKNNLTGIGRALGVVARHAMFSDMWEEESTADMAERAKCAMLSWCGLGEDGQEGPLQEFIHAVYPDQCEDLIKKIRQNKGIYQLPLYSKEQPKVKNNYNSVNFERIAAEALNAGPLKRRYLVSESEPFDGWDIILNGNTCKTGKKLGDYRDMILKATAAYLLRLPGPEWRYSHFTVVDYLNWTRQSSAAKLWSFKLRRSDGNVDSFAKRVDVNDNVVKICCAEGWARCFRLVDEDKLDTVLSEHPSLVFYSDGGSGVHLQKNVRYLPQ